MCSRLGFLPRSTYKGQDDTPSSRHPTMAQGCISTTIIINSGSVVPCSVSRVISLSVFQFFIKPKCHRTIATSEEDSQLLDFKVVIVPHKQLSITGGLHIPVVTNNCVFYSTNLLTIIRPHINNYIIDWRNNCCCSWKTRSLVGIGLSLCKDVILCDLVVCLFVMTFISDATQLNFYTD